MPTRRTVARSEAFLDPTQPPAQRRVFLDAAENASPAPLLTNWFEVEAVLNAALEGIATGKTGVRDAVAEAKRQAEPLLAAAQSFGK
jgi:multiple sugar transport system substrate-binding protein